MKYLVVILLAAFAFACGEDAAPPVTPDVPDLAFDQGSSDLGPDASDMGTEEDSSPDLTSDAGPDMEADQAPDMEADAEMDAAPDMPEVDPLGVISGDCGEIDQMEIESVNPYFFVNTIDFEMDPYDDVDFERLSEGGQEIINDGNAGGSSIFSEVFSYEVLHRCEMAELLKTETEVVYTTQGKITDLLVEIDTHKVGVSVTRAVTFPRTEPYTMQRANDLLIDKLGDILESSANVAPEDAWTKQILHVIADEAGHATMLENAWMALDAGVKSDTIVVVTISEGNDDFVY